MDREPAGSRGLLRWLSGAAIGAAAMYLADPERGRRRRALATDKVRSVAHKTGDAINVASRDLGNRVQGIRAQAGHMFSRRGPEFDDEIMIARIRKEIGRVVSHPRAVKVTAQQGNIILHGAVLAREKEDLLSCVRAVAGVSSIEDRLDAPEDGAGIPSLQGEGKQRSARAAVLRDSWPPGLRALATAGGGVLGVYGLRHRSLAGMAAAALGLGLLARGLTSAQGVRLAGKRAISMDKSIYIDASPETVFDIWSQYEHFPRFMSHVQEVRDLGDGRSHWVVSGPGGTRLEWNALLTETRRPELLAWRSDPDASVQNEGTIHFEPEGDGTRVNVRMAYHPPAGAIGHAAASLFNGNPKRQMDDDLMRMKAFIETGIPPRDAAEPGRPTGAPLH